ncbi:MAG TPA: hypothetical protein VF049_04440 [Nocardioidaceae bacterium]|jgi:hypothetical protein
MLRLVGNAVGGAILGGVGWALAFSGSEGLAVLGWVLLVSGAILVQVNILAMGVALGLATHRDYMEG